MTHNAEDAAELIEHLPPDEQEQALRIMRRMAAGNPGYRPIDMDEMRTELEGLRAVMDIILADMDDEAAHMEGRQPSIMHVKFAERTVNLYQPALLHIFFCLTTLYRRAEEATS